MNGSFLKLWNRTFCICRKLDDFKVAFGLAGAERCLDGAAVGARVKNKGIVDAQIEHGAVVNKTEGKVNDNDDYI